MPSTRNATNRSAQKEHSLRQCRQSLMAKVQAEDERVIWDGYTGTNILMEACKLSSRSLAELDETCVKNAFEALRIPESYTRRDGRVNLFLQDVLERLARVQRKDYQLASRFR